MRDNSAIRWMALIGWASLAFGSLADLGLSLVNGQPAGLSVMHAIMLCMQVAVACMCLSAPNR